MWKGIVAPFTKDLQGYPATAEDFDKVDKAIECILMTSFGERVMRPTFGSDVVGLVFEPSEIVKAAGVDAVNRSLATWESRIRVVGIDVQTFDDGRVEFDIDYTLKVEAQRRTKKIVFRTAEFERS